MGNTEKAIHTIDDYIAQFPPGTQAILQSIRQAVREAAPGAAEKISYGMPAFYQNGVLVYFAACASHIGFYPTASGIEAFKEELADYKSSKGAVRFPIGRPMPLDLIQRIVRFRVNETMNKP
jgi:uncharacterized protein YdhG (YjbR/CyaY superfamily)